MHNFRLSGQIIIMCKKVLFEHAQFIVTIKPNSQEEISLQVER